MQRRTRVIQRALLAAGLVSALSFSVYAQTTRSQSAGKGPGVAVIVRGSVGETIDRLAKLVADNGMTVMGELHQGEVLARTGLRLKSETIFVGDPTVGKELFSEEPGAGVLVPVRINVYAHTNGQTIVRYIPPSQHMREFGDAQVTRICATLDRKLQRTVSRLSR